MEPTRRHVTPNNTPDGKPFKVHDPDHPEDLPPEGRTVVWSRWWGRRERDGSVTVSEKKPRTRRTSAPEPGA